MSEEVFEDQIILSREMLAESFVDVESAELSEEEKEFLAHVKPLVDNIQEWKDSMTEEEKN